MKLKIVRIQEIKGSYYIYIPKNWAKYMRLRQSDEMCWYLNENELNFLKLGRCQYNGTKTQKKGR